MPETAKPAGWEKLAPERESAFDPKSKRNYHTTRTGEVVWEEVPPGFRFRVDGTLEPIGDLPSQGAPTGDDAVSLTAP